MTELLNIKRFRNQKEAERLIKLLQKHKIQASTSVKDFGRKEEVSSSEGILV